MRRPPLVGSQDARILLRRSSEAPKSLFAKLPLDAAFSEVRYPLAIAW
jgi:hypothetical protein